MAPNPYYLRNFTEGSPLYILYHPGEGRSHAEPHQVATELACQPDTSLVPYCCTHHPIYDGYGHKFHMLYASATQATNCLGDIPEFLASCTTLDATGPAAPALAW